MLRKARYVEALKKGGKSRQAGFKDVNNWFQGINYLYRIHETHNCMGPDFSHKPQRDRMQYKTEIDLPFRKTPADKAFIFKLLQNQRSNYNYVRIRVSK